jgi:hypothetical protein
MSVTGLDFDVTVLPTGRTREYEDFIRRLLADDL